MRKRKDIGINMNTPKKYKEEFFDTLEAANKRYEDILYNEKYCDEITFEKVEDKIVIGWWKVL